MNRLYIGIACAFLVSACTPEKDEETTNTAPKPGGVLAGTPSMTGGMPASAGIMGGTVQGGEPNSPMGGAGLGGAAGGQPVGGGALMAGAMAETPSGGIMGGVPSGGVIVGGTPTTGGGPMGGDSNNACFGLDDGTVIVASDFGECEYAAPCDLMGTKARTQTVCTNGMPLEQMEQSGDGCERDTEGVRVEEGGFSECQYIDPCIVAGKKVRSVTVCRGGQPQQEMDEILAGCWRDTNDKLVDLSEYSQCEYADECTPRGTRFRSREICVDSRSVARIEEDSRGCQRARGEAANCDLPCPAGSQRLADGSCACDRQDYRIKGDFSGCEPKAGWTILIYMHADNDLEDYSLKDIAEMAQGLLPFAGDGGDLLKDINLIIQIDRSELNEELPLFDLANFSDSRRIKLVPGGVEELAQLGELDFDDPAVLTEFIEWGVQSYPARKFALLFWDHGISWSGFGGDYDNADPGENPMFLHQLGDGIRSGLQASALERFDLIGFDACLMASIETAHELSDVGHFLVASEDLEWGNGWNYEPFVTALVENPDMPAHELGRRIMDSFFQSMPATEKTATLSISQLNQVPRFAQELNSIASSMADALEDGRGFVPLAQAINRAQGFAQRDNVPHNRDVGSFLRTLKKALPDEENNIKMAVQGALDQYANVVPSGNERHGAAQPGATGLAAYMPVTGEYFAESIAAYRNSGRFADEGSWATMLTKYHEILALDVTPPEVGAINFQRKQDFVTASAALNSDDTAQAFALTFALLGDTLIFIGQAPVVPKETPEGRRISFDYYYDAAYLEQGDTSLYTAASYDYGAWLAALEADALSDQALTGWIDVQVSEDEGESWTDGTLKLSVSIRDFSHKVNGFYVESFGAVSEKEIYPDMWLRTVYTQIQNDELIKTPSEDFIILGDQGLKDVKFEYYVLQPEYRIYIAFMVDDYTGNQTIKWSQDAIRIQGQACQNHATCEETEYCDPTSNDCRPVFGSPFVFYDTTAQISETRPDGSPWDDIADEAAPDPQLQCIVGDTFVGEFDSIPNTSNPMWDEQIIAIFKPGEDVSISVWDDDGGDEIEAIGDVTIESADIVEHIRAGRYEYESPGDSLSTLRFDIKPLYP